MIDKKEVRNHSLSKISESEDLSFKLILNFKESFNTKKNIELLFN